MARKKRTRNASGIGAVSVPEGSESILESSEGEGMEEQELCACGHLAEACECKHKCEFECNDEECVHQAVQAAEVEPEAVAEEVVEADEAPVAEPEQVEEPAAVEPEAPVAVAEPVVVPVVPEPIAAVPVAKVKAAAPAVAAPSPAPAAASSQPVSQTANKFASILGEKSGAARRYLSGRTRY